LEDKVQEKYKKNILQSEENIETLRKDLIKADGLLSGISLELIKREIYRENLKIKEAEIEIRYTDYQ
jgi:hypothetical protein